ncbi:MAG: alpha-hydroxy-acid oxidizing enzyme [Dehalococcoidia bacterium]|nr:MAG: alpha-hydroxy-acid oxidizing enzyme [Dehalococcoidia bacterium]
MTVETEANLPTIPALIAAARARLPSVLWDYATGGAESETTLRRNRAAFDRLAFRPRVLRDVSRVDVTATFLGQRLALPVMLAPVGSIALFHPDGALAAARAAAAAGTLAFIGSLASPALEEVRAGCSGPLVFQLYLSGDRRWQERIVRRVEEAGYLALCVTVDSAMYGRRERDLINRFVPSLDRPNLRDLGPAAARREGPRREASATWDDIAWLRSMTPLPLILKGILTGEDARLAVEHGVDVVYVSNHGGRQLDHAPATIEVLPEVVAAVSGRAGVVLDSGVVRGTDVLKALAFGADAVLIGKLLLWGLAASGEEGVRRALDLIAEEIRVSLANLGASSLGELSPASLRPSEPPPATIWPIE